MAAQVDAKRRSHTAGAPPPQPQGSKGRYLGAARRERDLLLAGGSRSRDSRPSTHSPASLPPQRASPSPAGKTPSPAEPPPAAQSVPPEPAPAAEEQSLLRLRVTALSRPGALPRSLQVEAEGTQTLAELCLQAHPGAAAPDAAAYFTVAAASGGQWRSAEHGGATLRQLGIADGESLQIAVEGVLDAPPPPPPPPAPEPGAVGQAVRVAAAPPLRHPPPPAAAQGEHPPQQGAEGADDGEVPQLGVTIGGDDARDAACAAVSLGDTPKLAASMLSSSVRTTGSKSAAIPLKVIARDKWAEHVYNWEVPAGEKLVQLCRRCCLTEPKVPAKNTGFRGHLVTCGDRTYSTKQHGRLSLRELGFTVGDQVHVSVDWANVESPAVRPAPQHRPKGPPAAAAGAAAAAGTGGAAPGSAAEEASVSVRESREVSPAPPPPQPQQQPQQQQQQQQPERRQGRPAGGSSQRPLSPRPPSPPQLSPPRGYRLCALYGRNTDGVDAARQVQKHPRKTDSPRRPPAPPAASAPPAPAPAARYPAPAAYPTEALPAANPCAVQPPAQPSGAGESASMSPGRQRELVLPPPPVPVPLPDPAAGFATLSPSRGLRGVVHADPVAAAADPRQSRGVSEEEAWISFREALGAVLSEQDLLLISAETVRDLIRHYGFASDAVLSAKIELHWKRLSGRLRSPRAPQQQQRMSPAEPPAAPRQQSVETEEERRLRILAKSPPRDPRHTLHCDRLPVRPRDGGKGPSPEALLRAAERQARRDYAERQRAERGGSLPTGLPFGGGPAETPCEGPIGRRLDQGANPGRRRPLSPSSTQRRAPDKRASARPATTPANADPNAVSPHAQANPYLPYSKEMLSVEYSETRDSQQLVALGRRHAVRDKNSSLGADLSVDCTIKADGGLVSQGHKGRAAVRAEGPSSCDPNQHQGESAVSARRCARSGAAGPPQCAAPANPNEVGTAEGALTRPVPCSGERKLGTAQQAPLKCLSVGPPRPAAGCDPNQAGPQPSASSPTAAGARQQKSATRVYRCCAGAAADPNQAVFNSEGERRKEEATREARVDSTPYFAPDTRPSADCNPNTAGAASTSAWRQSRKGLTTDRAGEPPTCLSPAHGASVLMAPPVEVGSPVSTHVLYGPAGASGAFSPGLRPPARTGAPRTAPAASDPNDHPGAGCAPRATTQSGAAGNSLLGLAVPARKGCGAPVLAPQERSSGRRRNPSHPASRSGEIGELLRTPAVTGEPAPEA